MIVIFLSQDDTAPYFIRQKKCFSSCLKFIEQRLISIDGVVVYVALILHKTVFVLKGLSVSISKPKLFAVNVQESIVM